MEECTIKALLTLDTVAIDGKKVIQIPLEDILRGYVSIRLNNLVSSPQLQIVEPPKPQLSLTIPAEIKSMYKDENKMTQDVADYLKIISKCWQYRDLKFQTSILKKAAAEKPSLNTMIFTFYGKGGDEYLTTLVLENLSFIKHCWDESK